MSEMLTEKEKYHLLQGRVCEKLPYYAADITLNSGYDPLPGLPVDRKARLKRLNNVKQGKVICLPDLVALVRCGLPDFEIPAELLPAEQEPVTA